MIFIALGSSLWMIFPILFFISLIRSKIRNRKLLRKMEEEEKLAEQEIQIVSEQIEIDE